jgi:hypothetical protein
MRGRKTPPTSRDAYRIEARRIAASIAELPTLLNKALPDDAVSNLLNERHEAGQY